jgi:hypothetical protein
VLSFYAQNPIQVGGANPQVRITFYTAGGAYISDSGFQSFASAGTSWKQFSFTNAVPATAAQANVLFIQAVGAGASWDWVTLLDDVSVTGPQGAAAPPPPTSSSVYIDPSKGWQGYMNWSPSLWTTANFPGGGGVGSSGWGIGALQASFSGALLTLSPNVNVYDNTSDAYWVNPDGTGANLMDANMYVQDDTLAGQTVTFSGYVWNANLSPELPDNLDIPTCVAFIKDLSNPSYSLVTEVTSNLLGTLPANGFFSITLQTTAGDNIQYGFETMMPDANPTTVASLGTVVVASNAPPAGPVVTGILPASPAYVTLSSNVTLVGSVSGGSAPVTYQWQENGVNLTDGSGISGSHTTTLNLTSTSATSEGNYSLVAKDGNNRTSTNSTYVVIFNPANLTLDPNASYDGYVNGFANSGGTVGGYDTGFTYPTSLLRGSIVNNEALVQPNTSLYANDLGNAFWINADGTPAQFVEQDYYIQNDALAGNNLTYNGYCVSDSIDSSYVFSAWITDFASNYGSSTTTNVILTAGQRFSLSLASSNPGDHIQYGLRLLGLDNSPSSPLTLGSAYVSVPPAGLSVSRVSGANKLSFSSVAGHNYTIQYKNNITDATWTNLNTTLGTGAGLTISDSSATGHRFYRLSVQ